MTRLSEQALKYLDQFAAQFGGASEVLSLLPDVDLEKLLTFPGKVFITKPWSAAIDLRELGYVEGTPYSLLDNQLKLIKTDYSEDGYFGGKEEDQQILLNAQHASFLYLQFLDQLVLLWVCNRLSQTQLKQQINQWQKQASLFNEVLSTYELFLQTNFLLSTDVIQITHVPATWSERYTIQELRNHPNKDVSEHKGSDEIISIYFQNSGWYLFEVIRGSTRSTLILDELQGVGVNKVRSAHTGAYFVALTGREQTTAASSSIVQLPSKTYGIQGVEPFIRLEGVLKFREPELCLGKTTVVATANVMRRMLPATSTGKATVQASLAVSMDGIATGVATPSTRLPLPLESERLVVIGAAVINPTDNVRYCSADGRATGIALASVNGSASDDEEAIGEAEATADIGIIKSINTLQTPTYQIDPLELIPLTYDLPATMDPLERVWFSVEYKPYTFVNADDVVDEPIATGVAFSNAEITII
ncbi:hypothetical protein OsccyDRAFT_0700 [Leptolyngbyaceae cyanobacterium JSC-12]|nr:hypothetical protein OsccyDRAFT_0700 [Leptolyngbyaceae cyanobacterium JSC-12]